MLKKIRDNKILNITFNVVKTIITIFLLLLICIIFIQRVTNNNFAIGGIRVFTIITGSMEPVYKVGDMIISIETKPEKIEVGDNVVYKGEKGDFKGKIVTHQVIEKKQDNTFITKGVNNTIEDPEIKGNQIIGKVIYKTFILTLSIFFSKSFVFFWSKVSALSTSFSLSVFNCSHVVITVLNVLVGRAIVIKTKRTNTTSNKTFLIFYSFLIIL